ncbi:MAG: LPS assembly lipoprotein LptE [Acidobacteriota bacterium]
MKKYGILFLVCSLMYSCGYHLRGTGGSLPPHIEKIRVPMFKNNTPRFELDVKLTQSVIDELVVRGKVEITDDSGSADAILVGEISSFNVHPIAFSGADTADRYNITIVAKITLRDLVEDQVLFSNPNFVYKKEYEVEEGADFESVETEAIEEISESFARSLVIMILEGF